jgi:PAS domain S-box-containing protein
MPEMSGFELAAAVKERKRTAGVPILFLTAQAIDVDLVFKGYQVGAVDYLVKPLVPEMVRAKIAVFAELFRQRKRIEQQSALLVEAARKESELRMIELRLAGERRYRTLAEAVPHIVWTCRPDGTVDYFNWRWFEYTGLSVEKAAGSWDRALHPDDAPRCRDDWQRAMRSGQMFEAECRLRRSADETFRWHLCRAVPERSTTGEILSWLGTFTDIEDQKRVQAVLSEFKGTLDAEPDAVVIFEPKDWRIVYVNHGSSALLGRSTDELLAMRPVDFMADHDGDGLRELLAPLLDGSQTVLVFETRFRRREALAVPIDVSVHLIRVGEDRLVLIARDITDRKRAQVERELLYQEAVDAVRARDQFLSIASHELRTPLSSLQLQMLRLLQPPRRDPHAVPSPEQLRSQLEKASKQIERLSRLISALMDVSKITAGRLRLELEEVDLSAVVHDVAARFAEDAARAQCSIDLNAKGYVVGKWDRLRVEQVVTNLLTNAFKFGTGKPVELTVREEGPRVRLTVRDHGIGIAPDDVERIFHRYEQAISSRAYGGLGLGLYIARQIVEAHGGAIRVESEPGAGSTFTVELPREPPPPAEREGGPEHAADDEHTDGRGEAYPARGG